MVKVNFRDLVLAVASVSLVMSLGALDIFGIGAATKRQGERNFQSVADALAFSGDQAAASIADDILVIEYPEHLTDPETDTALPGIPGTWEHDGWPLPMTMMSSLLEYAKGEGGRAKSIFFDIAFGISRAGGEEQTAFCAFAYNVFLASRLPKGDDAFLEDHLFKNEGFNPSCIDSVLREDFAPYLFQPAERQGRTVTMANDIEEAGGLPVFIGASISYLALAAAKDVTTIDSKTGETATEKRSPTTRELRATLSKTRLEAIAQQMILDSVAVLVSIETLRQDSNGYVLFPQNQYVSPALAMAGIVPCGEDDRIHRRPCHAQNILAEDGGRHTPYHYLDWSGHARRAEANRSCIDSRLRLHKALSVLIFGQAAGTEAGALVNETSCKRFETVPLPCILAPASDRSSACARTPKANGRHLFFGVSVPILGDNIVVPVQGQVPAVHSHATAFEGLLRKAPPKHVPGTDGSVMRFILTTAGIYLLAVVLRNIRRVSEPDAQGIVRSPSLERLFAPLRCVTAAKLGTALGTYALALGSGVAMVAVSRIASSSGSIWLSAFAVASSLIAALFLLGLAFILFDAARLLARRAQETGGRAMPLRGRLTRLFVEALLVVGGLIGLVGPFVTVVATGGAVATFTIPILAILGSAAIGSAILLTLIGLELTGRISIEHCSVEDLTHRGSRWQGKQLGQLLETLPVNAAERLHGSGIHLLVLGGICLGIFGLSFVISDWSRLPASHIFSISMSAALIYWLVFREKVEDDLRPGASVHARRRLVAVPPLRPNGDGSRAPEPGAPCPEEARPRAPQLP